MGQPAGRAASTETRQAMEIVPSARNNNGNRRKRTRARETPPPPSRCWHHNTTPSPLLSFFHSYIFLSFFLFLHPWRLHASHESKRRLRTRSSSGATTKPAENKTSERKESSEAGAGYKKEISGRQRVKHVGSLVKKSYCCCKSSRRRPATLAPSPSPWSWRSVRAPGRSAGDAEARPMLSRAASCVFPSPRKPWTDGGEGSVWP